MAFDENRNTLVDLYALLETINECSSLNMIEEHTKQLSILFVRQGINNEEEDRPKIPDIESSQILPLDNITGDTLFRKRLMVARMIVNTDLIMDRQIRNRLATLCSSEQQQLNDEEGMLIAATIRRMGVARLSQIYAHKSLHDENMSVCFIRCWEILCFYNLDKVLFPDEGLRDELEQMEFGRFKEPSQHASPLVTIGKLIVYGPRMGFSNMNRIMSDIGNSLNLEQLTIGWAIVGVHSAIVGDAAGTLYAFHMAASTPPPVTKTTLIYFRLYALFHLDTPLLLSASLPTADAEENFNIRLYAAALSCELENKVTLKDPITETLVQNELRTLARRMIIEDHRAPNITVYQTINALAGISPHNAEFDDHELIASLRHQVSHPHIRGLDNLREAIMLQQHTKLDQFKEDGILSNWIHFHKMVLEGTTNGAEKLLVDGQDMLLLKNTVEIMLHSEGFM